MHITAKNDAIVYNEIAEECRSIITVQVKKNIRQRHIDLQSVLFLILLLGSKKV